MTTFFRNKITVFEYCFKFWTITFGVSFPSSHFRTYIYGQGSLCSYMVLVIIFESERKNGESGSHKTIEAEVKLVF
jgi:hypothetical protein